MVLLQASNIKVTPANQQHSIPDFLAMCHGRIVHGTALAMIEGRICAVYCLYKFCEGLETATLRGDGKQQELQKCMSGIVVLMCVPF